MSDASTFQAVVERYLKGQCGELVDSRLNYNTLAVQVRIGYGNASRLARFTTGFYSEIPNDEEQILRVLEARDVYKRILALANPIRN